MQLKTFCIYYVVFICCITKECSRSGFRVPKLKKNHEGVGHAPRPPSCAAYGRAVVPPSPNSSLFFSQSCTEISFFSTKPGWSLWIRNLFFYITANEASSEFETFVQLPNIYIKYSLKCCSIPPRGAILDILNMSQNAIFQNLLFFSQVYVSL